MNFSPSIEEESAVLGDDRHCASNFTALHADGPHKVRPIIWTGKIDLGLSVAEHVHMGRLVIIGEDHDTKSIATKHRDHEE